MSAMSHTHMDEHTGALNEPAGMTPFPQPGPSTTRLMPPPSQMMSRPTQTLEGEVPLHIGPEVVGVAMQTSPQLHDAGDGLNGNGRRELTYADLRSLYRGVDGRTPTREIILHLTGNMERFIWAEKHHNRAVPPGQSEILSFHSKFQTFSARHVSTKKESTSLKRPFVPPYSTGKLPGVPLKL